MAGSKEEDHILRQSPRTRGIIQHFERQVQRHTKGLDNDMQVRNDKIGQLEAMQIATNTKLTGLETAVGNIDKSLAALLRRFDELHVKTNEQRDDWEDEYIANTEQDEQDAHHLRRLRTNRRGMGGFRRREVRNNDDAFSKIKFKIPLFDGT
jgi:oligoendopeptidase F